MEYTKVTVRLGATINIGNFESVRVDYEAEANLGEFDDYLTGIDQVRNDLAAKLQGDLRDSNGGKNLLIPK
jgi:hypothetical protein